MYWVDHNLIKTITVLRFLYREWRDGHAGCVIPLYFYSDPEISPQNLTHTESGLILKTTDGNGFCVDRTDVCESLAAAACTPPGFPLSVRSLISWRNQ